MKPSMAHLLTNPFTPTAIPTSAGVLTPAVTWIRHRTVAACFTISLHASALSLVELAARSNSECNVLAFLAPSPLRSCKPRTALRFSWGDALQ